MLIGMSQNRTAYKQKGCYLTVDHEFMIHSLAEFLETWGWGKALQGDDPFSKEHYKDCA